MFFVLFRLCLTSLFICGPIRCSFPEDTPFYELQGEDAAFGISSDLAQGRSQSSRSRRDVDIDVNEIVQLHNQVRAGVEPSASNMKYMSWDAGLAAKAHAYSEGCMFEHNPDLSYSGRDYTAVGENMYLTTADALNWFDAVESWANEVADYTFNNDTCREGKSCGHYTQVVWAESYQVGCGVTECDTVENMGLANAILVICNYGPGGNFVGQKPYEVGDRCSACGEGETCEGGLCRNPALESSSTCLSVRPLALLTAAVIGLLLGA